MQPPFPIDERPRSGRAGFTLLEVMVAVGVLAVAMAGGAFLLTSAFGTYRHQDRSIEVGRVVHDQMETLSADTYDDLSSKIHTARGPLDPPHGGTADQDFQSLSSGEAISHYRLDPPAAATGDWQSAPLAVTGAPGMVAGPQHPESLQATMHLQYWDPTYDSPSLQDKGLIRAEFSVAGGGNRDRAVKYLARSR